MATYTQPLKLYSLVIKLNLCSISSLWERMEYPVVLIIDVINTRIHRPLLSELVINFSIHYKIRADSEIGRMIGIAIIKLTESRTAIATTNRRR